MTRLFDRPVVLALDQAAHSGWAIYDGQRIASWGLATKASHREAVVLKARQIARTTERDLLVIYEDHAHIPAARKRNTATILGMGDARGRWLEQLERFGHSKAWVTCVDPLTWRAKLIGSFGGTDAIKARAVRRASQTVGQPIEDHNVAEAICIAEWAAWDGVAQFFAARERSRLRRHRPRTEAARNA